MKAQFNRQSIKGISTLGFLLVLTLCALLARALFAIWPAYWDDYFINQQISAYLLENPDEIRLDKVTAEMNDRFQTHGITQLKFEQIATLSLQNGLGIYKDYEVRKHFLFNIDLVLTFEKNFDQRSVQTQ